MNRWRTSIRTSHCRTLIARRRIAADVVGDRAAFGEPTADHHVGTGVETIEEQAHGERVVLAVGVELHRALVAVPHREREPGTERAADADVERKHGDVDAGFARDVGGAVGRTVAHDEHLVLGRLLRQLLQHRRQRLLLVVRRDDHQRARGPVRAAHRGCTDL